MLLTMFPAENYCEFLKMYHIVLWRREKWSDEHNDKCMRLLVINPLFFFFFPAISPPPFNLKTLGTPKFCQQRAIIK